MPDAVYDIRLVCLSLLVALVTAHAGLNLGHRIRFSQGRIAWIWLVTASSVLGGGIWTLHMVAMLAYIAPVEIHYDLWLSFSSLLLVVVSVAIGFIAVQRDGAGWKGCLIGSACMCAGTAAMHAIGMASMQMNAYLVYDKTLLGISAVFAMSAIAVSLRLARRGRRSTDGMSAAACLAAGIAGLHYTAMYAATMICTSPFQAQAAGPSLEQKGLFLIVMSATFVILFLTCAAYAMDRQRASQEAVAWQVSEKRFRNLYSNTPVPLHSVDLNGIVREVSNYWLQLLGYDRSEVIGRRMTSFMTEASAMIHAADWPALLRGGELRDCELQFRHKDGRILDVLLSEHVERDGEGRFLCANGGLTDITMRKQAEEACRQAQKMEAVGQLTGGIAHDFNNLLSAILGSLELAMKRVEDPRAIRMLETAQQAANRGAKLTAHMLAFSRRQDLAMRGVDVNDVISGLRDMLQRLIGPLISVGFDLQADAWPALSDPVQLEVSIVNLAVNARDAMPKGGLLTIRTANVTSAPGLPDGDYVAVSVSDTGEGMPERVRNSAFQPFFTTKGPGKGTGLGLAMVYGFASQAGGTAKIDSAIGRGTVVTLYLRRTAAEAPNASSDMCSIPASPSRILLVDDDESVRLAVREMLLEKGHHVVDAANGGIALEALKKAKFDLMLTDFAMPVINGVQLARQARALNPDLPVLIMTGYVEGDLLSGWSGSTCGRLNKPFNAAELNAAVSALVPNKIATEI